jgi:hypothetical protein
MAEVACFCGCLYSFDGDAAACPRCGERASVATGSRSGTVRHNLISQSPYDELGLAEIPVAEFALGHAATQE